LPSLTFATVTFLPLTSTPISQLLASIYQMYLDNQARVENVTSGAYKDWVDKQY